MARLLLRPQSPPDPPLLGDLPAERAMLNTMWIDWAVDTWGLRSLLPRPP
jgi:hypothetical protein